MKKNIALITMAILLLPAFVMPIVGQNSQKKNTANPLRQRPNPPKSNEPGEREVDADMGGRYSGNMSREEYLRRRGEMVALLRGFPLPSNIKDDPRAKAIRQMRQQETLQRQQRVARNGGKSAAAQSQAAVAAQASVTNWTPLGPAPIPDGQTTGRRDPVSGRVLSIDVHPANPDIVYVGTAQGGLYRTLDGGNTWVPLLDIAAPTAAQASIIGASLAVGAIAVDPVNPSTIFIGTGEGNFCADCFFGVGLYRIRNADTDNPVVEGPFNSATNTSNGRLANSRSITKILVNPNDDNVIFVATGSGVGGLQGNAGGPSLSPRGLFRSTNAQSDAPTFTKLNVNGPVGSTGLNTAVRDIEFEPGNPNVLLAAVADTLIFTAANTTGVYRTTNAQAADPATVTFTRTLVSSPSQQAFNVQLAINKVADIVTVYVALDESDPAVTPTTGDAGVVRKSIDGGQTFGPILPIASGFCGGQCFYDMPIAVDPTDPNKVYIGGSGDYDALQTPLKRSLDGGVTFAKSSTGLHPDSHEIRIAPSNPLVIYHGNDGGIWRSSDSGTNWVSRNTAGFSATQFVDLSTHPTDRQFLIGGTQDNGTPFLQPEGTFKLGDFGDGGYSIIDQNATDTDNVLAYHTYFNQTNSLIGFTRAQSRAEIDPNGWPPFFGCADFGNGLMSNNGIRCDDLVLFYAPMNQGPGNPNTLYFGAQSLYRSVDKGETMPAVSQKFTAAVSAIGISPQNDNVRIVGLRNGGLFGTSTGANPLADLDPSNTVPNAFIARAVVDPQNPSTAYVALGGYGLTAGRHVYKTTNLGDSGTTWTVAGNGLPDIPVNAFVVDPGNSNILYAGTDIGVYRSNDSGANWTPFSEGLPRVAVFDMEFQARNNPNVRILRIATHGRGLYEISVPLPPSPLPSAAGATLVNESCPPANGAIDPGERVSINLALVNNGTASTSNLTATLQSSSNVIAPSQTQNYGALAPGATASRTFSFTANGNSRQTIPLTLALADGATNLGTVTYTVTLGSNTGCTQARVVTTLNSLTRSGSDVVANLTVQNQGITTATSVTLTSATLGATSGTPIPQNLGNLGAGQTATTTVTFANPGPSGTSQVLRIRGVFDGTTQFGRSQTVTLP